MSSLDAVSRGATREMLNLPFASICPQYPFPEQNNRSEDKESKCNPCLIPGYLGRVAVGCIAVRRSGRTGADGGGIAKGRGRMNGKRYDDMLSLDLS